MSHHPFDDVHEDDVLKRLLDRSQEVGPLIDQVKEWWRYDLVRRRAGAAYEEAGMELDLATFMLALSERKAVINIPSYSRRRARSVKEGETVVSARNRHGKVIGVTANKSVFSFSTKIQDVNVVTMETVGEPRNFMMVDVDGTWYDGWKTVELLPKAEENDFLRELSQEEEGEAPWSNNKVDFDHFIDKKRWRTFYGRYYLLTMALIARLYDEAQFYAEKAKDLEEQEVREPERPSHAGEYHRPPQEELESIVVDAFEAQVDIPPFEGEYKVPDADGDEKLLELILARRRKYIYKDIPWLRWSTRATEYAFHFHGNKKEEEEAGQDDEKIVRKKKPAWAKDMEWEQGFKLPRKRTKWNRIEFAPGIGLRYRVWKKTEKVKLTEEERAATSTDEGESTSSTAEESGRSGDEVTGSIERRKREPRVKKGWATLGKRKAEEVTGEVPEARQARRISKRRRGDLAQVQESEGPQSGGTSSSPASSSSSVVRKRAGTSRRNR